MDYNLKDEEEEIIEAFSQNMSRYGYNGFYSFSNKILNGYLIYKQENYWIFELYVKGEITLIKKYTNIYNLCQQLFELAAHTGYTGTFDEFKQHFGEYLESSDIIIDYDEYTGQYQVTPLPNVEQILRTKNKVLKQDVIIEQIPYYETTNLAGGYTAIIG